MESGRLSLPCRAAPGDFDREHTGGTVPPPFPRRVVIRLSKSASLAFGSTSYAYSRCRMMDRQGPLRKRSPGKKSRFRRDLPLGTWGMEHSPRAAGHSPWGIMDSLFMRMLGSWGALPEDPAGRRRGRGMGRPGRGMGRAGDFERRFRETASGSLWGTRRGGPGAEPGSRGMPREVRGTRPAELIEN